VVLTNTASDQREAQLRLDLGVAPRFARDLRTGHELPILADGVLVQLPAASGTAVRLE
jgi:hypothetical protein